MNDHELRRTAIGRTDHENTPAIEFDAKRVLASRRRGGDR